MLRADKAVLIVSITLNEDICALATFIGPSEHSLYTLTKVKTILEPPQSLNNSLMIKGFYSSPKPLKPAYKP